jgi:hypothetical protein
VPTADAERFSLWTPCSLFTGSAGTYLGVLYLRSGAALADRETIDFGPAFKESPEEAQGEGQHSAFPGKPYALA